jgi:hypothetical protein
VDRMWVFWLETWTGAGFSISVQTGHGLFGLRCGQAQDF